MWNRAGFILPCLILAFLAHTRSHAKPKCGKEILLQQQELVLFQLTQPDQLTARGLYETYQRETSSNAGFNLRPSDVATRIFRKLELAESRVSQTPLLLEAMKKLPEDEREAFICRILNGYSIAVSARTMASSPENVRQLTKNAFLLLVQGDDAVQNAEVLREVLSLPGPQRSYLVVQRNRAAGTPKDFIDWVKEEMSL